MAEAAILPNKALIHVGTEAFHQLTKAVLPSVAFETTLLYQFLLIEVTLV